MTDKQWLKLVDNNDKKNQIQDHIKKKKFPS